jgi:hypothetical protein
VKRFLFFLGVTGLLWAAVLWAQSTINITDLPNSSGVSGTDDLICDEGASTVACTAAQILTYVLTNATELRGIDGTAGGDLAVSAGDGTSGIGGATIIEAGTSDSGIQGTFQIVDSWNGTATLNGLVCSAAVSSTVADCAAGAVTGIVGPALSTTTPVKVVSRGTSLILSDNTAVVGDNFCMSKTDAAKGHSNGSAVCSPGTVIGIVRSITELTSLGQATTTLPLVTVGIVTAGQAGSTGNRVVTGTPDPILESDNGGLVIYNSGSSIAASIACPTATAFGAGWRASVKSVNSGVVTITATGGCYIDTVALTTIVLPVGFGAVIESDGTNFYTHRTFGAGTSGGIPYFSAIDVVESSAALPAGDVVVGGGAGSAPTTISPDAGTDITADLEEEAHCSEHDSADVDCSGETIVFATPHTTDTNSVREICWKANALAGGMSPADQFPSPIHEEGTNIDIDVLGYDDTVNDECAGGVLKVPADVQSGSTITFRTVWYSASATSGNVLWDFRHLPRSEGEDWDAALTIEAASADAVQGTVDQVTVTTWTETLANTGWTASDQVEFLVCRDTDTGDTLTGDAYLTLFCVEIPRV